MSLQRGALLAALLATLGLAPSVFAACIYPVHIFAEVETTLSTTAARVDAPAFAEARNLAGEPCNFLPISADVKITKNGADAYRRIQNGLGTIVMTLSGAAEISNCYASSIRAEGVPLAVQEDVGSKVCWLGPREGPRTPCPQ